MPILNVRHITTYQYRRPVGFGEHRFMFRPRDSADQRLIESRLDIAPEPSELRWLLDAHGNNVGVATFNTRATELRFESRLRVEHRHDTAALETRIAPYAQLLPFTYGAAEAPDLQRSAERHYPDPGHAVDEWARSFFRTGAATRTADLLADMARAVRRRFTYIARFEPGLQDPATTLRLGTGTCRDFAVLVMEALRSLGLATRFVTGYLHAGDGGNGEMRGGGNTHAWLQVFLPGAGWVELDPTNDIVGSRDLVRVAVTRDPEHAIPLGGTWLGFPADCLGMEVNVRVTAEEPGEASSEAVASRLQARTA